MPTTETTATFDYEAISNAEHELKLATLTFDRAVAAVELAELNRVKAAEQFQEAREKLADLIPEKQKSPFINENILLATGLATAWRSGITAGMQSMGAPSDDEIATQEASSIGGDD